MALFHGKFIYEWMIWGYPYFRKPPNIWVYLALSWKPPLETCFSLPVSLMFKQAQVSTQWVGVAQVKKRTDQRSADAVERQFGSHGSFLPLVVETTHFQPAHVDRKAMGLSENGISMDIPKQSSG